MAVPTHGSPEQLKSAQALVQWDPERSARGGKLNHRTIQLGIGRVLAPQYASEWIAAIEDVTPLVSKLRDLRKRGEWEHVERLLPVERELVTTAS